MSTKIEMTPEQASLFKELKLLTKRANQRILRLERETGIKDSFAIKQLSDYLSSSVLNAWSETGRVKASKKFTLLQMKSIKKAVENFLEQETSTVSGVKKYQKRESKISGINIPIKQLNALYQARKNYTWIYQYLTPSEFWGGFVKSAKDNNWGYDKWIDELMTVITDRTLDEELKQDLIDLYDYAVLGR